MGGSSPVRRLKLTLLADLRAAQRGLKTEHGLALWIEAEGHRLLFDTGRDGVLFPNADRLGLDLAQLEAIVLSHGHDDHAGGLPDLLSRAPEAQVFLHPRALLPHFHRAEEGCVRPIGLPEEAWQRVLAEPRRLHWTPGRQAIFPGVFVTGGGLDSAGDHRPDGSFFQDAEGECPAGFQDEQALWFCTHHGPVVLLGCTHSGVRATLELVQQQSRRDRIHGVVGGLHLLEADDSRIQATVDALVEFGVQRVAPCHCVGPRAEAALVERFGQACTPLRVGDSWQL